MNKMQGFKKELIALCGKYNAEIGVEWFPGEDPYIDVDVNLNSKDGFSINEEWKRINNNEIVEI